MHAYKDYASVLPYALCALLLDSHAYHLSYTATAVAARPAPTQKRMKEKQITDVLEHVYAPRAHGHGHTALFVFIRLSSVVLCILLIFEPAHSSVTGQQDLRGRCPIRQHSQRAPNIIKTSHTFHKITTDEKKKRSGGPTTVLMAASAPVNGSRLSSLVASE